MMAATDDHGFRVGPDSDPDRYVLGPAVASGAEGILYRGSMPTSMGFAVDVAVKMLQPRFLARVDEWHIRWAEQVELLRSLQFPGVVAVRDGFLGPLPHAPGSAIDGRTLYLVMNWVDGEPLDEWVRRRPHRRPLEALKILLPVAAALDVMHSGRATGGVPVVHRDVKPSNIVVTDGATVLVDFGLTRGLPDGHRLSGVTGTPGYLAPEATADGIYTPATDRYAFGAVTYFVLTGAEPPVSHQPAALRAALDAVPDLSSRAEVIDHLMAMLDEDPAARPLALANWIGQLRRSSLEILPEALAPPAPSRHPAPAEARSDQIDDHVTNPRIVHDQGGHRRRRLIPVVAVIGLVATACVTWFLTRTPTTNSEPRNLAAPLASPPTTQQVPLARGAAISSGSVAVTPDGTLYINDAMAHVVWRVDKNGTIATAAGSGPPRVTVPNGSPGGGFSGDGGPATMARIDSIGVAVGPDGSLFLVSDTRVRQVDPGGRAIRKVLPPVS